jgi:hypothetical protein
MRYESKEIGGARSGYESDKEDQIARRKEHTDCDSGGFIKA